MHHKTLAEQFMGKHHLNGGGRKAIHFFRFGTAAVFGVFIGIYRDYGQRLNPLFYKLVGMIVSKMVEQCLFKHENVPRESELAKAADISE